MSARRKDAGGRAAASGGAERPGIVVLGAPRSGTTLLRRLLDAHPSIACPGETNVLAACARFLQSDRIAEDVDVGVLSGLHFAGFEEEEVLSRLRDLAFGFLRDHAARQGKPRWADKSAMDAFHLPRIEKLCGDRVRWVVIHRHGLDVAVSLADLCEKNGGYLSELHEYVRRHPRTLEAFAHAWADVTSALADFAERRAGSVVTLRYEDLTADPEREMRRVLEFLGEPWDDTLLGRALEQRDRVGLGDWKTYGKTSIDRGSVGRWEKLSRATVGMMARICNPALVRLGYGAVATEAPPDDAEARRRHELGLLLQKMKTPGGKPARK